MQFIWTKLDSSKVTLLVAMILYGIFMIARLANHNYDWSYFIAAGDYYVNEKEVPIPITVKQHSFGYDGQFYFRMALDPFPSKQKDFGIQIDSPPYRLQRWLYPITVHILSFSRAELIPMVMVLVNYAALCSIGWLAGGLARSFNKHAFYGLLIILAPGFLLSFSRNLTEPMEVCLLLAGLYQLKKNSMPKACLFFTLAVLAKETALMISIAGLTFSFYKWIRKRRPPFPFYVFGVPVIIYVTEQLVLYSQWKALPVISGPGLGLPFRYAPEIFQLLSSFDTKTQYIFLVELALFIPIAICFGFTVLASKAGPVEKLSFIFYGILLTMLNKAVWPADFAFFRASIDFYILGAILLTASSSRLRFPALVLAGINWALIFSTKI